MKSPPRKDNDGRLKFEISISDARIDPNTAANGCRSVKLVATTSKLLSVQFSKYVTTAKLLPSFVVTVSLLKAIVVLISDGSVDVVVLVSSDGVVVVNLVRGNCPET